MGISSKKLITDVSNRMMLLLFLLSIADQVCATPASLRNQVSNSTRIIKTNIRAALIPVLTVRRGVLGEVNRISSSPDGRYLNTEIDGQHRIWDLHLAQQAAIPAGLSVDLVKPVPFSNDQLILTPSGEVWFKPYLDQIRLLNSDHTARRIEVTNSRTALIARSDGQLMVVDLDAQQATHRFATGLSDIRHLVVKEDLVAIADSQEIRLFSLIDNRFILLRNWKNTQLLHQLAIQDDASLVTLAVDGQLGYWHLSSDNPLWSRGQVTSFTLFSHKQLLALGSDGSITQVAINSGAKQSQWPSEVKSPVSIHYLPDHRFLAIGSDKGMLHLVDQSGKRVLRLISTAYGWAVVDSVGRFDADLAGNRDVGWLIKDFDLELDQFTEPYYEPGLIPRTLGLVKGDFLTQTPDPIEAGIFPPPLIILNGSETGEQKGTLRHFRLSTTRMLPEQASGETRIQVFLNGKRLPDNIVVKHKVIREGGNEVINWSVKVMPRSGVNQFKVIAFSPDRTASAPLIWSFQTDSPGHAKRQYLSSIGINQYEDELLELNYAEADARSVNAKFSEITGDNVQTHSRLMLNQVASKQNILDQLEQLKNIRHQDRVIVFMAGHGITVEGEWYFLSKNARVQNDFEAVARGSGISSGDLTQLMIDSQAAEIILFIDACFSGFVSEQIGRFAQMRAMNLLSKKTGVHVVAATRADQEAPEYPQLGHGLFTYTILKAFESNRGSFLADQAPRDGRVTVSELNRFIGQFMPQLGRELSVSLPERSPVKDYLRFHPVTPVVGSFGADFFIN